MGKDLLSLPFAIQIALGAGYLAYMIAYAGIRQHHSATDAIFRSLVFGLLASAIVYYGPRHPATIPVAFFATLVAGLIWRRRLKQLVKSGMRKTNLSWTDDVPTAWLTVVAESTDVRPGQLAVDLDNGRTLMCDSTADFEHSPHGPCTFGLDGSIAMYVTAERDEKGNWIEKAGVKDRFHGDLLTYIPASSIKRVDIRCWTKANEKAVQEEGQRMAASAAQAGERNGG